MRKNRLRAYIEEKKPVITAGPGFPSPELIEFLGHLGFEGVFIDAEHGTIGLETVQELVRAADAVGLATLTRVPKNDPAIIMGHLETGAASILVPHINSADDAVAAVQAVKFGPDGIRGAHSGTRAANFGATQDSATYFRESNRETLVAAMIEEVAALDNLAEIVTVQGLDLCIIGPGDLSMSMGLPGQPFHPEVQKRIAQAFSQIRTAGVSVGTLARDGKHARELFAQGYHVAIVSVPGILAGAARQLIAEANGEA